MLYIGWEILKSRRWLVRARKMTFVNMFSAGKIARCAGEAVDIMREVIGVYEEPLVV